jgi:hypothetical protein
MLYVFACGVLFALIWFMYLGDYLRYRYAKNIIISYVQCYKRRCTGNNRFVVTVSELQNIFREFETHIIEKVWQDLINKHLIHQDAMDGEWCIK